MSGIVIDRIKLELVLRNHLELDCVLNSVQMILTALGVRNAAVTDVAILVSTPGKIKQELVLRNHLELVCVQNYVKMILTVPGVKNAAVMDVDILV
ncbi:hypothetical protein scyTo_0021319 [Scyliorhinus torazame]|uniref:Uncharacterized protein n=1 Tax=Scyliorhinus torazame TaxID=75743 RepID=A0A401Q6R1_SCYTO|nr:hypothetical protein [Scyliorhinus torazame]